MRVQPARLVVVGTLLVDLLLYLERHPAPGEVTMAEEAVISPGAGYNLLLAASRLRMPAAHLGLVGSGPFGSMVTESLTALGVESLLPPRSGRDTGVAVGLVSGEARDRPSYVGAAGVETELGSGDLASYQPRPGDAVYISGYDLWNPATRDALVAWISELGDEVLLVLDPGPVAPEIAGARLESVVARTDVFSAGHLEAAAFAGPGGEADVCTKMVPLIAPEGMAVVRSGSKGCWVGSGAGGCEHVAARAAAVKDPTGAGDVHLATMLARLCVGDPPATAARWANVAASLAVEHLGAAWAPSLAELESALTEAEN